LEQWLHCRAQRELEELYGNWSDPLFQTIECAGNDISLPIPEDSCVWFGEVENGYTYTRLDNCLAYYYCECTSLDEVKDKDCKFRLEDYPCVYKLSLENGGYRVRSAVAYNFNEKRGEVPGIIGECFDYVRYLNGKIGESIKEYFDVPGDILGMIAEYMI